MPIFALTFLESLSFSFTEEAAHAWAIFPQSRDARLTPLSAASSNLLK